ncbi:exported protein of unknown function [uncultured Sphingopyxis sp.]|uniref:Uncharacterized protein n=1 Tax=uncultured Sphingopyxis sp. TaxID=310581 RepID=A0A1Y5PTL1_9SPHN|nr:hypothetical protein [uncultured Sphingopyxis sp.]SBV33310.1 exported protein of unknown function [uncultured Sphingopyxis sp.]
MPRKLSFATSRRGGERLVRLLLLTLAGVLAGVLLGEESAEPLAAARGGGDPGSYARYSANPDARLPQGETAAPCFACPDSYGVAARLRAERESRMESAFRELGAVDTDAPLPPEPVPEPADDGYRYGGRFPDPAPRIETPNVDPESSPSPSGEGLRLDRSSLDRLDERRRHSPVIPAKAGISPVRQAETAGSRPSPG